jgi:hypothetical protein
MRPKSRTGLKRAGRECSAGWRGTIVPFECVLVAAAVRGNGPAAHAGGYIAGFTVDLNFDIKYGPERTGSYFALPSGPRQLGRQPIS